MSYNIVGLNRGYILMQRLCRAMKGPNHAGHPACQKRCVEAESSRETVHGGLAGGAGVTVSDYVQRQGCRGLKV